MDVTFLIMDFLTESDQSTATEMVMFMRELIANYPNLRMSILQRFADSRVLRRCLWLFGEYCEKEALNESVIEVVHAAIRPLPWWPKDPQPRGMPFSGIYVIEGIGTKTAVSGACGGAPQQAV